MNLSRRNFLKYCGVGSIVLGSTAKSYALITSDKMPIKELSDDLIAAIIVWRDTQALSAHEYLANKSQSQIRSDIKVDFKNGETLSVNGWQLSKTEVAVAVVFAQHIQQEGIHA